MVTALRLEACVKDVSDWMSSIKSNLNSDKTERLLIASQWCSRPQLLSLNVCGNQISRSVTVRNVAVVVDSYI